MKRISFIIILGFCLLQMCSCDNRDKTWERKNVFIDIQPFEDISSEKVQLVTKQIKEFYPFVNIKPAVSLPKTSYYFPRNRYRADSLIRFLRNNTEDKHVTIGLTNKDISTTNDGVKDWGVMGLGFRPGNACVVSTFRLNKSRLDSQFYKVCIHELGHTSGLDHCQAKACFMQDAEGGNKTDELSVFCNKCRKHLISKGWTLK